MTESPNSTDLCFSKGSASHTTVNRTCGDWQLDACHPELALLALRKHFASLTKNSKLVVPTCLPIVCLCLFVYHRFSLPVAKIHNLLKFKAVDVEPGPKFLCSTRHHFCSFYLGRRTAETAWKPAGSWNALCVGLTRVEWATPRKICHQLQRCCMFVHSTKCKQMYAVWFKQFQNQQT